ncbi:MULTISPECIES: hypothetical protein [unclassified Chamaesiphon]|uniref:hypothetical protein n=1 Tax=unclassified Chamaesiphon TaxID=2620921 RepID=UPI00286A344E|nr:MULTISPECIES: hypothetical protein [unclassified Chamaesiphon]
MPPPSPLKLKNVLKQQSHINLLLFKVALGNRIVLPVRSLLCRNTDQTSVNLYPTSSYSCCLSCSISLRLCLDEASGG